MNLLGLTVILIGFVIIAGRYLEWKVFDFVSGIGLVLLIIGIGLIWYHHSDYNDSTRISVSKPAPNN
jgi:hypothetical protein